MAALRPSSYKSEDIIAALQRAKGLVGLAADELQCDRKTIYNHIKKSAAVRDALESVRGRNLDIAENKLLEAIEQGELAAITYSLSRIGRERGYSDRHELTGPNGGGIETTIRVVYGDGRKGEDDSDAAV